MQMFHLLAKKVRSFSDERGIITVEYSLVIVPFLGLITAIIQIFLEQLFVSHLDRGVQRFAAGLRSGSIMLRSVNTNVKLRTELSSYLCPSPPALIGFDCTKLQVQLFENANCSYGATVSCWDDKFADFAKAVRKPPSFKAVPYYVVGLAGYSQYLTVYYPFPKMSSLWSTVPTAIVNGKEVHGLLSTAMWINDPSVGVF